MKMSLFSKRFTTKAFGRLYCNQRLIYEIPDEYHNSFYLANASLLQIVNYFVHSSYQQVFHELVANVKQQQACSKEEANHKVRQCINRLDQCEASIDLNLSLRRLHGGLELVRANRGYHGLTFFSKTLGGFRLEQELPRLTSQGLAVQATYRNALFGIPMAGATGGIRVNPTIFERSEMDDLLRQYLVNLPRFEGMRDLIEPDIGSTSLEMDSINAMSLGTGPAYVLAMGKSPENRGLKEWGKAAGKCVLTCLRKFLSNEHIVKKTGLSMPIEGKTYILQGVGKIGKQIGEELIKEGAKCIGVREHDCTLYDKAGVHIKALLKHITQYGTVRGFSEKVREHDFDAIFGQPCDILILAATQQSVTCNIADKIQAKIIVEAANLPITPTAYRILIGKGKLVIPGLLSGAGSSLLSYIEYKNDLEAQDKLTMEQIASLFETILETTINNVMETESKLNLKMNFLHAAYVNAIRNLFRHIAENGMLEEEVKSHTTRLQQ